MEDRDLERVRNIASSLGEHFGDYLICVKIKGGGVAFRASEKAWGIGAAELYVSSVKDAALLQSLTKMEEERE